MMTKKRLAASLLAAGIVVLPPAAMAQSGAQSGAQPGVAQSPNVNCQVTPGGGAPSDAPAAAQRPSGANRLNDCGSVLVPPVVGDADMVEPAPDKGRTPVIDPSQIRPKPQ